MALSPNTAYAAESLHWLAASSVSSWLPGPAVFALGMLAGVAAVAYGALRAEPMPDRQPDIPAERDRPVPSQPVPSQPDPPDACASTAPVTRSLVWPPGPTGPATARPRRRRTPPDEKQQAPARPVRTPPGRTPPGRTPHGPGSVPGLRIGLLGTLTVNGQPGGLAPAQSQLIVALALSGTDGLANRQLCGMLGADEDHPRPTDSLRQLIVRTRRQLGRVGDGREWIEHHGHGHYALHPDASVDLAEFDALTATGLAAGDRRQLAEALGKVRGEPFDGCFYWWLDLAEIESTRARIVTAAAALAEIELNQSDPASAADAAGAARAARTGLAADPSAEQLWRLLMRAEHAAGNLAGVREAWSRCRGAVAEISADGQPDAATTAVYDELLARCAVR